MNQYANTRVFLSSILLLLSFTLFSQRLEWAKSIQGHGLMPGNNLLIDSEGNIIFSGDFSGTEDFDPSEALYEMTSDGFWSDNYIVKMTPGGELIWAKKIEGDGDSQTNAMALDAEDNI